MQKINYHKTLFTSKYYTDFLFVSRSQKKPPECKIIYICPNLIIAAKLTFKYQYNVFSDLKNVFLLLHTRAYKFDIESKAVH